MMVSEHWQSEVIGTDNRWGSLYVSNETASASVVPCVSGSGFYAIVPALTEQTNTVIAAIPDAPFFRSSALRCGVPLRTKNTGLESGATPMCRARWYDPETGRWLSKDPIGIDCYRPN